MEITGKETIPAPVEAVWNALNDPAILRQCIPGCETLDWTSETTLVAAVVVKLGLIKARFEGTIELSNLDPPHSYTIAGQGRGGLLGLARGAADVVLNEAGERETELSYMIRAETDGKIAQLGGRLVGSAASKLGEVFFSRFVAKVTESVA